MENEEIKDFHRMVDELEEDEEESEEESEEEEIIIDEEWTVAGKQDIIELRPREKPRKVQIPINIEEKIYIELFIRDLNIDQQLALEESFATLSPGKGNKKGKRGRKEKSGSVKLNFREYYRLAYEKSVVKTNPPNLLKWKSIRYFSAKSGVWDKIKDELPDPMSSDSEIGNIDENEAGN
jgi:hypothetical protein